MKKTEKKILPLGVGDNVRHYDNGTDGRPQKWAYGVVTEVGEETFVVQWDDLEDPTEYEWQLASIVGDQIIERDSFKLK